MAVIQADAEALQMGAEGGFGGYVRFLGPNQTPGPQRWKWKVLYAGKKTGGPNSKAEAKLVMGTPATPAEIQLWSGKDEHFDSYSLSGDGMFVLNPGMEMMLKYTFSNQSADTEKLIFEVKPA